MPKVEFELTTECSSQINRLCKPLGYLGLSYFCYERVYKGEQTVVISNQPEVAQHIYCDSELYSDSATTSEQCDNKYLLWASAQDNPIFKELRNTFNIGNGLCIIEHGQNFNEVWFFGGDKAQNGLSNLFINDLMLLKFFLFYFRECAKCLLDNKFSSRLLLTTESTQIVPNDMIVNKRKYLDAINIKRYYLDSERYNAYLTSREVECLKWYASGKTMEETSIILGVCERTTEAHLANARRKLNCYKLSQLIGRSIELGLVY